ncbi:MAG TPA: hypothetical protein DDW31_06995 [candidate division Zixibacteria bacterium]|nr:hypothetical protein [candidate division Zixibacteria bacterium]
MNGWDNHVVIISISDIHGDPEGIVRLSAELSKADLVLVSGDITNFGGRKEAAGIIDRLGKHAKRILAVPGNCDRPEVGKYLGEQGVNLDQQAVEIGGLWFSGLGGSLPCPGRTLLEHSEDEFGSALDSGLGEIGKGQPFVLLCHQPPHGTKVDRVMGGLHVGSRRIRQFIEESKPLACFCGHIHESPGVDRIGETAVCNPGPLGRGGYVRAVWRGGAISVQIESFKN